MSRLGADLAGALDEALTYLEAGLLIHPGLGHVGSESPALGSRGGRVVGVVLPGQQAVAGPFACDGGGVGDVETAGAGDGGAGGVRCGDAQQYTGHAERVVGVGGDAADGTGGEVLSAVAGDDGVGQLRFLPAVGGAEQQDLAEGWWPSVVMASWMRRSAALFSRAVSR